MLQNPTLHAVVIVIRGTIVSCLVAALFGLVSFLAASGVSQVWNAFLFDRLPLPFLNYWQAMLLGFFVVFLWNAAASLRSA